MFIATSIEIPESIGTWKAYIKSNNLTLSQEEEISLGSCDYLETDLLKDYFLVRGLSEEEIEDYRANLKCIDEKDSHKVNIRG